VYVVVLVAMLRERVLPSFARVTSLELREVEKRWRVDGKREKPLPRRAHEVGRPKSPVTQGKFLDFEATRLSRFRPSGHSTTSLETSS
jgi:hypothetical protein